MTSFPLSRPARIAVLVSGRGSNLEALLRAFPAGTTLGEVRMVISNRASAPALAKAHARGVDAHHVDYADREAFEARVVRLLDDAGIDLVCLAGFMRILSPEFVRHFQGRLLNVHPSLLPSFRGLHAQRQALEAGVRESGCTVHFVDEGVDTGHVIVQRRVPVLDGDSEEALSDRIRVEEHIAFPEAVRRVLLGQATLEPSEVTP